MGSSKGTVNARSFLRNLCLTRVFFTKCLQSLIRAANCQVKRRVGTCQFFLDSALFLHSCACGCRCFLILRTERKW